MLMLKYLFCWTNFLVTSNLSHFNGISHVCAHRLFLNNYTANGSLMIVSQLGSISAPNLFVSSVYDILDTMRALTTATCTPLMLSTPLIGVPHLSYNTKYHMNYCMIQFPIRSFLKFLVYVCFVPLQPHEHVKLQPHSPLCCFLGYRIEQKEYRSYDRIAKRLRISRHVVFLEHKMYCTLSNFMDSTSPTFSVDTILDIFLEIPSTNSLPNEPIILILARPSQFDLLVDLAATPNPKLHQSTWVTTLPSHLCDYYCIFIITSLHEP